MGNYRRYDTVLKEISERFKKLREEQGKSQADVYIDTDLNMARVEGGKTSLSISTICILCEYYGVSLEEFFKGIKIE